MPKIPVTLPAGLLVIIMSLGGMPLQAQDKMSLQEMVAEALEANYDIRIVRNEQRQAEKSNSIGNAGMLPVADLFAEQSYTINNSRQVFVTGDSQEARAAQNEASTAQASVRWVVFDGLAMFARKNRLAQLAVLGKTNTRYFIEQTAADLAKAYYQLKQEAKLLEAYRKTLQVSEARLELQQKGMEIGTATVLDLQRAEVDRNTDSALVLSQVVKIEELKVQINQTINRDLEAGLEPTDAIELDTSLEIEDLSDKAQKHNAQLNQQQIQEMVASHQVDMERGALFPELELFGNYNFSRQSNEVGFLESSRSFGPNFGVRVRFNLFNGGQQNIALQNAKIEAENEELRTGKVSQEISAALKIAYMRWENELKQVSLEKQSAQKAEQTLEIASKQYELGAINNVDFRQIQLNFLNAQVRYLQAQYRAKSREIELHRLSGQLMEKLM